MCSRVRQVQRYPMHASNVPRYAARMPKSVAKWPDGKNERKVTQHNIIKILLSIPNMTTYNMFGRIFGLVDSGTIIEDWINYENTYLDFDSRLCLRCRLDRKDDP